MRRCEPDVSRTMTDWEANYIIRVFLHGNTAPDRVFGQGEHPGLKTTIDNGLRRLLEEKDRIT